MLSAWEQFLSSSVSSEGWAEVGGAMVGFSLRRVAAFQLAGSEDSVAMGSIGSVTSEVIKSWLMDSWGQTEGVSPLLGKELGSELKKRRLSVPDLAPPQPLTFNP